MHKIDGTTWAALICVAIGWFWMNTLVATFGPIQHVAHFYDLAAILKDPIRLLTGVGDARSLGTAVFSIVCLMVLAAPLLPRLGYPHMPRLLGAAPLLLMLLCSTVLYVKSSSAHIEADSMGRIGGYLARWANGASAWTGDVVARHISVGPGGYLSFIASGVLAAKGLIEPRGTARPHIGATRRDGSDLA
jgi:hypothetical protein